MGERGGARGRFRGFLCFSANWDYVHVPWLFGQLDLAGMTANFSLTNDRDPSPEHSFVVSYLARD